MKSKNTVREFVVLTFAMLLVAAAVYFFMVPSKIVMGSISGFALVLSQLTGITMSLLTFLLNAVLLVVGFLFIGRDFGAKTVYTSILLPVFLWVFERLIPITESVTGNLVFDVAAYICDRTWTGHVVSCQCFFRRSGYRGKDHQQVYTCGDWKSGYTGRICDSHDIYSGV